MKSAVRGSVAQIGNHTSKSEASIQSVTTLNIGDMENSSTDRLEAGHQREHKDVRYFWIQEQVRDEDFSIKQGRNYAYVGTKPIFTLELQCCSNRKIGILQTMDPTLNNKMKADEAYDGSCEGLQPRYVHRDPRYVHRNRNRDRQLSVLIVNIETDAQTE